MSAGGWSVKWARLGSDECLTLLRVGWQPFAALPAGAMAIVPGDVLLILRRYNLPGDAE